MSAQHTPGPWTVKASTASYALYGIKESHERIKALSDAGQQWGDVREADMRLIAAAPDLIDALRELHNAETAVFPAEKNGRVAQTAWGDRRTAAKARAVAAIAKATGIDK